MYLNTRLNILIQPIKKYYHIIQIMSHKVRKKRDIN